MGYIFTTEETQKITNRFGQIFFEKLSDYIKLYSDKWKLKSLQLVDYFSVNCIFLCESECFGSTVLKIGNLQYNSAANEYNILTEYNGNKFCKVYAFDLDNGVLLIEQIRPATWLRVEKDLEKRLSVFVSLFNGLHIAPKSLDIYPTYMGWVNRITKYMRGRKDYADLYSYMKKAENICVNYKTMLFYRNSNGELLVR
ncbi:MAG: hypothetical protein FWC47_07905 [Oscillospiraceae bacterium]|nr:hypothetical protein [Oscillospiraceae bacterium]